MIVGLNASVTVFNSYSIQHQKRPLTSTIPLGFLPKPAHRLPRSSPDTSRVEAPSIYFALLPHGSRLPILDECGPTSPSRICVNQSVKLTLLTAGVKFPTLQAARLLRVQLCIQHSEDRPWAVRNVMRSISFASSSLCSHLSIRNRLYTVGPHMSDDHNNSAGT